MLGAILRALNVATRTQAVVKVASLGWAFPAVRQTPSNETSPPDDSTNPSTNPGDRTAAGQDDAVGRSALAAPENPSIVVLPFTDFSDDPNQDYFSDGMVDEITIALGRIPRLFVIASNSAFSYKGRAINAKQIGTELRGALHSQRKRTQGFAASPHRRPVERRRGRQPGLG